MLWERQYHSCVVFDGKIVVTGGIYDCEVSVEAYDHHLNEWTYMPDLLEGKVGHGSVAMGNKFYVIGVFEPLSCEVLTKFPESLLELSSFHHLYRGIG